MTAASDAPAGTGAVGRGVPIDALLETVMEHLQSAWLATGHSTFHERYERHWPLGSTEYHLQAAERAGKALFQAIVTHLRTPASLSE